jgi:hypothetical protein
MRNLTILYSSFKRALENSPHIKVIDSRSQFDPPSESHKRAGAGELRADGFEVDDWLQAIIGLSKGNSVTYHVIRDRQNRGEGSFNLNSPQEFLLEAEPWVAKNATNDADKALLQKVRVIDQPSVAQTFTGIVTSADTPPKIPQQLVYFKRGHLLPMDLSFTDYYEMLANFMGIVDWQLLFTDATPATPGLGVCFEQLLDSYEAFRVIFPDRDFSIWEAKLRAKQLIS